MHWTVDAACVGIPTNMFFPKKSVSSNAVEIKQVVAICSSCPVREECLEQALLMESDCGRKNRHGIWGGKTPGQRHKMSTRDRRGNVCKRGHELTPENTYTNPEGYRNCRTCRSINRKRSRRRAKAA